MTRPLRVLVVDEGVLGHRTMVAQLHERFAADPTVEASFATVPPPGRLGRLLLRRWRRLGDGDLYELRWRLRWSWWARRLLTRHRREADVAYIVTQASALLCAGQMRRIPCVLCVDATVGQFIALGYRGRRDRWSRRQQRLLSRLERRAAGRAAAVVALTNWNAAALRQELGLPGEKLAIVHPGLDADWWGAAAERRRPHDGPLRVLFVGNEVERKGLGPLREAIATAGAEAVLDVVTADPVEPSEWVRVHRGVEAHSERLRELYAAADVFALPTRADAVPWVVIEAMASGLPVVASRVGAIEELVGDCGEVVEPGDAGGLAAALLRLADPERRRRVGRAARERVRERYDSSTQTARLVDVLRGAAGVPPGPAGGRRLRRRAFVAIGLGAAGAALAAPYAVLIPDDEFADLVASRLGIDAQLASQLLERAREAYGELEYDARAAAFAFAVRDPAAAVLPDAVRERAVSSLVEPMLSAPAPRLAYAITGNDPGGLAACAGLVRDG